MGHPTKNRQLTLYCRANNISIAQLAAALGYTPHAIYSWRRKNGKVPWDLLAELERENRARGEWPLPGPTPKQIVAEKKRQGILKRWHGSPLPPPEQETVAPRAPEVAIQGELF